MSRLPGAITIGGSHGALEALNAILPALPADLGLPVVVALHLLPTRPSGLTEILERHTVLKVKEAEDKEPLAPGTVYVAAPNYHLLVEMGGYLSLSTDDLVHYSRPSIDVLFESAADACGHRLVGVLLSGANQDGASGLARIRAAGGFTIVQSPETAPSSTMPRAALELGAATHVHPAQAIGSLLVTLSQSARFYHPNDTKVPA